MGVRLRGTGSLMVPDSATCLNVQKGGDGPISLVF